MASFFSFLFRKKFPNAQKRSLLLGGPLTVLRAIFFTLFLGLMVVVYVLLINLNQQLLVAIPARGGTLTEGIIGSPRFLNPILAATETDIALTNLLYAGLMKEQGDGTLVPELAASYEISPDGRTYTFLLRDDLTFHDQSALTSSDVAFTIEKLQDSAINTRSSEWWQKVMVSTPNEQTIVASLPAPDETFLRHMTIGILPFEYWHGIPPEVFNDPTLNLSPIGAGAFKVSSVEYDERGAPKKLTLSRNRHYALGAPLLRTLVINVFGSQESLKAAVQGGVDLTFSLLPQTVAPEDILSGLTVIPMPSQQVISLWHHENRSAFSSAGLLGVLSRYIDKEAILATVENGYGLIEGTADNTTEPPQSTEEAQHALEALGYALKDGVLVKGTTPVALAIATRNDETLLATARALSQQLATLGVICDVQVFDLGTFQEELAAGTFSLVLTDGTDSIPQEYVRSMPLYRAAILAVSNTDHYGITQSMLDAPALRYATVMNWHERIDHVYPFIARR